MLINFLKKLANISIKKTPVFSADANKQKKYLLLFPEPKDNIERSFFQYKCQNWLRGFFFTMLTNVAAFFVLPFYLLRISCNNVGREGEESAVFIDDGLTSIIVPDSIREKYGKIRDVMFGEGFCLDIEDYKFMWQVYKRYPFSFYFLFKNVMKIAMYRAIVKKYNPKAIIAYNEFSFTSSILTQYCACNQVQNINIMHGEKLFTIDEAFANFHSYYVWDDYYVKLFSKMRQDDSQFIIELPEFLKQGISTEHVLYDYKYYIGNDSPKEMMKIDASMFKLQQLGYKVCIRPHPRITVAADVEKYITHVQLEKCEDIDCVQSLKETKAIIAQCSTVLFQGYRINKDLILDDISNLLIYNRLLESDYIIFNKPHKLLSDVLKEE